MRKSKMRKQYERAMAYILLIAVTILAIPMTALAEEVVPQETVPQETVPQETVSQETEAKATWKENDRGWHYENQDGTYVTNQWKQIGEKWYHFSASGYMQHGWVKVNDRWYYLGSPDNDASGAMRHGWVKVDDKWYYLGSPDDDESGAMRRGWFEYKDKWYYLGSPDNDDSGAMAVGWRKINDKWYYFSESGAMQTGWKKVGEKWYYFSESGAMHHGWLKEDEKWYYLGWPDEPDSGAMQHGWLEDNEKWYYLGWPDVAESGAMRTGLVDTNEGISDTPKNYFLAENGVWQSDFTGMYVAPDYKSHYILNGVESKPDKVIYLTFDDGPGPYTDRLIDILDKYGAKATFFVSGYNTYYWDSIGKAYRSGHSIGNHTYSHNYAYCYSSISAFWAEWQKTEDIIVSQTGKGSELIRFPGGSSNTVSKSYCKGIMSALAKEVHDYGYEYFDWDVSSGDAGGTTSSYQVYKNIINGCSGAWSIVLCHDIKSYTVDAIEDVLIWGISNGYTFMGLDKDSPTVHHGISN